MPSTLGSGLGDAQSSLDPAAGSHFDATHDRLSEATSDTELGLTPRGLPDTVGIPTLPTADDRPLTSWPPGHQLQCLE